LDQRWVAHTIGYTDYPELDGSNAGAGLHGNPREIVETAK
jgi:hypothetical protein